MSSGGGSDFTTNQRQRYIHEINRAIPTRQAALDATTVTAALSTTDSVARQPIAIGQILEQVGDGTGASAALARDAACRSMPYPGPAMRDPAARTGCGWWFVSDPATPSVGAYGTRRGPMHPTLDRDVAPGEWVWDPMDAQRREAQKQSARIQTCPDIQFSSFPNMGWCTSTGRAISTDGAGNPLFPRTPGGDCPGGQIVTNAASCPPPTPPPTGAPPLPPGTAGLCTPQPNGALSPACIQALTPWAGCSTGGALAQSLGSSSYAGASSTFQSPYAALQRRGFSLHSGIVNDGQLSVQAALQSIGGLSQQAGITDGSRATAAAQNLCYGKPYDPCAGIQSSDTGPFDPTCIDRQLDAAGYAPNGGLRPAKIGMDYWNQSVLGTWQGILDNISWWKTTADTDTADPPTQANAIQKVYGVGIQWPRSGCNYNGMSILRYAFQNADPSLFGAYPTGPQTHFLGRMLQSAGLQGAGIQQTGSTGDMLPATGSSLEGNRQMAIFRPTTGGTYQFLINYDDTFQYTLLDSAGNTVVSSNGSLQRGGSGVAPSAIVSLIPDQEYRLVYDTWSVGGPWTKSFQMSVNGGGWQPLPSDQLYLPVDRRQPLVELAFHKMPAGTTGPVSDTQGILQNWFLNAPTGSVAGQPCLVVGGHGAYCGNWNKYSQGMRLRALKTICMKLYIKSGSVVRGGGTSSPSIYALYNLPSTNTAGAPRLGAPTEAWDKPNRTAYFELTTWTGDAVYPYGTAQKGGGDIIQQTFLNNIVGRPVPVTPSDTWYHYAFVWADDFTSYAIYIDGKLVANLPAATYDPALILEQIRIGCDATGDGAVWQGGVAWFRGFDYRLSGDLIQRDMNDDWASLV